MWVSLDGQLLVFSWAAPFVTLPEVFLPDPPLSGEILTLSTSLSWSGHEKSPGNTISSTTESLQVSLNLSPHSLFPVSLPYLCYPIFPWSPNPHYYNSLSLCLSVSLSHTQTQTFFPLWWSLSRSSLIKATQKENHLTAGHMDIINYFKL